MAEQITQFRHIHDLLPITWFKVKEDLERMGIEKNYITYEEYINLCIKNHISEEISRRTLIGFLHDLGVVLYFLEAPRLAELGILNPQWVTNGVYRIINSNALFQNKGILTLTILSEILQSAEYPLHTQFFIIDMMRKFELCYDLEQDKTFLVPDLLPKDELYTGEWGDALPFQYHYDVLPLSIITRFIVRMHVYICKSIWRTGVVLKKRGNTALVKADTEDRKIYIWVSGEKNTRRDFLSSIRTEFDAIHKTITKIIVAEKVPYPNYPNIIFDYDELLQFQLDGITEIPRSINGKTIKVSVAMLIDGFSDPTIRQQSRSDYPLTDIRIDAGNVYFGGQQVTNNVATGGGAYVGRDVSTNGGSFTGRDSEQSSVVFNEMLRLASNVVDPDTREEVESTVGRLEKEAKKGDGADEKKIQRWFSFLAETAPDIWDVAVATFVNPIAGVGTVFQKVAKRAKDERDKKNGAHPVS